MEFYTFIYLLLFLGSLRNSKKIGTLASITLILIIGLRYDVGVDYLSYFSWYENEILGDFTLSYIEPGFTVLANLLRYFGFGPQSLFFASAVITIYFIQKSSNALSLNLSKTIFLFYIANGYFFSVNGVRQAIAAAVILWFLSQYTKSKPSIKILQILFASVFHYSALIFLLFILVDLRIKVSGFVILAISICFMLVATQLNILELILNNLSEYLPSKYIVLGEHALNYTKGNGSGLGLLLLISTYIFLLVAGYRYYDYRDESFRVMFNVTFIALMLSVLQYQNPLFERLSIYFKWGFFIYVPFLINKIKYEYGLYNSVYIYVALTTATSLMFFYVIYNELYRLSPYQSVIKF